MTPAEAKAALRAMQDATPEVVDFNVWSPMQAIRRDPYGVLTLEGAQEAYVRGDIEADELERRLELLLVAAS